MTAVNLSDGCASTNFHSPPLTGSGQGLRDCAHSAHNVAVEALHFVVAPAQQMKEQTECRTRLIRASVFAINIVGEE